MNIQSLLKSLAASRPPNPPARKVKLLMNEVQQQGRDEGDDLAISNESQATLGKSRQRPNLHPGVRLLVNSDLPQERALELRERIDHGYYEHPVVLRKVVVMLAGQIRSELP